MELSKKLSSELCDLETCSTSNKLNSDDDQQQQNIEANENIASIESFDCDSLCSLPAMKYRNINGKERNFSGDKKLVVELCDFMVCSRKKCDVPEYKKYRKSEKIQEHKKRKLDQQYFHSRKKHLRYEVGSGDEDASDVDEVSTLKEVSDVEEISDDNEISDTNVKKDPDFEEEDISEEEISYEEADDSDWEETNISGKKRENQRKRKEKQKQKIIEEKEKQKKLKEKEKPKKKGKKEKQTENLSSFELIRQKHLEDKMAFLKSLMMDEIVDELEETAKSQTQRKPKIVKPKETLEVSRKSKRMENLDINLSEQALEAKVYDNASTSTEKPGLPSVYSFEDAFFGDEKSPLYDCDKYFMNMKIKDEPSNTDFPYDLGRLDPMQFTSYTYPFTLTSIAFHPAVDRTIILAGSRRGQISLWNINTEPYIFAPHTDMVTLVKVNSECPTQIISSSLDGTLRQTDIEKKCFVEVFKEDDTQYTYFDFISPREFLVAQMDGYISMVDCREKRFRSGFKSGFQSAAHWKCSSKKVRTISAHPTKKDLCLSLDGDGFIKVWDRRFQKKCFTSYSATDCDVLSAFFSPVTGNSILCSSKLSICIYDSSHLEEILKYQWKIDTQHTVSKNIVQNPHKKSLKKRKKLVKNLLYWSQSNYYTMANWLPSSDSAFIVNNNLLKKTIVLESNDGHEMSSLNNSGGIIVFQEIHPVHNMLAVAFNVTNAKSKIQLYLREMCT